MRTEEAVSASIWLANVGRLTRTAKMNSDTPIDRMVRTVRRLLRNRFLNSRRVNLVMLPPRLLGWFQRDPGCRRHPTLLRADKYALVETINGVDESLRAGVVRDHEVRRVKLSIELCKQTQDVFSSFIVYFARLFDLYHHHMIC